MGIFEDETAAVELGENVGAHSPALKDRLQRSCQRLWRRRWRRQPVRDRCVRPIGRKNFSSRITGSPFLRDFEGRVSFSLLLNNKLGGLQAPMDIGRLLW